MITLNDIEEASYCLLCAGHKQGFNNYYKDEMRKASQVLAELRKEYVLVPREPTKELCEAIGVAIDGDLPLVDMRLTIHVTTGHSDIVDVTLTLRAEKDKAIAFWQVVRDNTGREILV